MKTKVLKKINDRVRIVENNEGMFVVEAREKYTFKKGFTEWHVLNQFSALKHALKRKHMYVVMILMRELGYRNQFVSRRTQIKKKK